MMGASTEIEDCFGITPLSYAVLNSNFECIDLLLKSGANPIFKNRDGLTPLELAKIKGFSSVYSFLYESLNKN